MILLQLSAAQGPSECCLAAAKAYRRLQQEAEGLKIEVQVVEAESAEPAGTYRSVLLSLEGEHAEQLASQWTGTLQWIYLSPYRPHHRRKNWFIGGTVFSPPELTFAQEIRFEALRSSGAGGQHVNKTDSAIRATHLATGISVKVQSERSQHANKRLAILLIAQRLAQQQVEKEGQLRSERRLAHHQLARGNPVRVFSGEWFEPVR